MSDLGGVLRFLREREHLTQQQVGERSGLSGSYISDLERGRGQNPTMDVIAKLAGAFNQTPLQFMGAAEANLSADEHHLIAAYRAGDLPAVLRLLCKRIDQST